MSEISASRDGCGEGNPQWGKESYWRLCCLSSHD